MVEAWLVGLRGETKGDVFPLDGEGLSMGRNPENDLVLRARTVSRVHARIEEMDGGWVLTDQDSSAGTYINGSRIRSAPLRHGDLLEIGSNRFRFEVVSHGQGRRHSERYARTLAKQAVSCVAEADFGSAIVGYQKCAALDPNSVAFRLRLADAYERMGSWSEAGECFRKALVLDQSCSQAAAGIARIDERRRVYDKLGSLVFPRKRPGASAQDPGEFVTLRSEHFEISFHIAHEHTRDREILRALERAYVRVGGHLGYHPDTTRVEVLASREEAHALAAKEGIAVEPWMAGFYDGKVLRLLLTDETPRDPHFPLISAVHEYTHLVCDHLSGGRCPAWLSEGLALYESQNLPAMARDRLDRAIAADALIPLALLENNFAALRYDALINLAYAQSFSLAEFLVLQHGWEGVQAFLQALKGSAGTEQALDCLNWTHESMEEVWKAFLGSIVATKP